MRSAINKVANSRKESIIGLSLYLGSFAIIATPLLLLLIYTFKDTSGEKDWLFLLDHMLVNLSLNSLKLLILNLVGTTIIAVPLSLILEYSNIPFKKLWNLLALIPLAIPLYVMAFIYVGIFEWASPIPTLAREHGVPFIGSLPIKTVLGVSFVFSLCLFPYVFLPIKLGLRSLNKNLIYSSYSLGASKVKTLWCVVFPRIRLSLLPGLIVVALESLADFGGVSVFNYDTFTTAIYTAWSGFFNLSLASKLSGILILFVSFLLFLERRIDKKDNFGLFLDQEIIMFEFSLIGKTICLVALTSLFSLSFLIPIGQLSYWFAQAFEGEELFSYINLANHTLLIALASSLLLCFLAMSLIFLRKASFSFLRGFLLIGYGIPGNIFGVGFLVLGGWLGIQGNTLGAMSLLIIGLMGRFMAIAYKNLETASFRISDSLERASESLGRERFYYFKKIWISQMKWPFIFSLFFVFIEVAKEMPLTLMLRPIGIDTLATKIYELTSEGEWQRASIPSLCLVSIGVFNIGILLLRERKHARD